MGFGKGTLTSSDCGAPVSRRRALALGGGLLGGLLGARGAAAASPPPDPPRPLAEPPQATGSLPVRAIRAWLPGSASLLDGVLRLDVQRTGVEPVHLHGVALTAAFALAGHVVLQSLAPGRAFCSGAIPVGLQDLPGVVAAIDGAGLELQSAHDRTAGGTRADGRAPRAAAWFVRWCGIGDPVGLARLNREVLRAAAIGAPPPASGSPLDAGRLGRILRGYDVAAGADGVVTVFVARRHAGQVDGIRLRAAANPATTVAFQPLPGAGAAAGADLALGPAEVNPALRVMRAQGFRLGGVGDRHPGGAPRLFSSYVFATGEPYGLAVAIRRGLDETDCA